ncbi:ABC transporter substrate-binding protein [Micromonospora sp. NPDC049204]|uniref:ABC transporter substrate-binding protein n=1 Tax=unclassified Micromonospora TaxID=2617518 RepID=UPI0033F09075
MPIPRGLTTVAAMLPVLLVACGTAAESRSSGGTPRSGGELKFALPADPTCLDPHQAATSEGLYVARGLVDSLTDQNPATGEIVPWLATSWSVTKDASEFTFHLREDATFADGTPVDAEAVKRNLDDVAALGAKSILGSGFVQGYKATRVTGPHTAVVTFGGPNAQFLQATSTPTLGLLAPTSLGKGAEQRCTGGLVGSGPFQLGGYETNRSTTLTRRTGYAWPSPLSLHQGDARLEKVTFLVMPESGVRTGSLTSGQVDGIAGVAPQDEPALRGGRVSLLSRANPGVPVAFSVNTARPIAANLAVRQAVQAAVNRTEVVDTVLSPSYRPATSALSSSTANFTDNSPLLRHDPQTARRLLDGAGWQPGPDGIRSHDGQRLTLEAILATNFGPNKAAVELIQQQLRDVGIELDLRILSIADYQQARGSGDYDLAWGSGTRADPDILRTAFSDKLLNLSRINDPDLQRDLDAQAAAGDAKRRAELVATAQRRVLDQAYQIPVFEMTTVFALTGKVHDIAFTSSSGLQYYDAWLS